MTRKWFFGLIMAAVFGQRIPRKKGYSLSPANRAPIADCHVLLEECRRAVEKGKQWF